MTRTKRALAFVAAVAAHIAFVALLVSPHRRAVRDTVDEPRMLVVSIAPASTSEVPRSTPPLPVPPVRFEQPKVDFSSPITLPPDTSAEAPPAPPSVDWREETQTAAARAAETLEAQRRKAKRAPDPRFARPTPIPEFGWDQARTHRIEALPEGGTIIHLSDRCVLAISGFIFPMCKLGKIEARGDLFQHMGDAPPADELP